MGEHSPELRAAAAARLGHLGVELASDQVDVHGDADITADGARCRTVVVSAAEDVEVARETRAVLGER
jgi:acetate kinase